MKAIIWTGLLVPLMLTSCVSVNTGPMSRKGNLENYVVEFTAAPGAKTLKVHSSPGKCHNGEDGCVEFAQGRLGTITFQFMGDQKEKDCNTTPRAQWVITQVQLSDKGDSNTDKGVFGGSQPDWLVDAFPGVDARTGLLYESTNKEAARSVTLIDLNNHEGEKVIYYQVTASNCDAAPETIDIDPSVRNKGK